MSTVYTCPWCGTNYLAFQTNCSNCGGPLLAPAQTAASPSASEDLPTPPPAPRPISQGYAWRLVWTDAWWIVAFVLGLLGSIFSLVGLGLSLAVVTAFVGIPFLAVALLMLATGGVLMVWRYTRAMKIVDVLRQGAATQGRVAGVHEQYSVTVNGRHPWVIRYGFVVDGQSFEGTVKTLNQPAQQIEPGKSVQVLYLPGAPQWSSIYPHP